MIDTHAAAPLLSARSRLFAAMVLLGALALLLVSADHALAGTRVTHTLEKTLDGSTTPAGSFSTPAKIAVDQATESVYVLDVGNNVIDKFDGSGNPQNFSALGTSALDGAGSGEPDQTPQDSVQLTGDSDIATDDAGNIYLASEAELVSVFAPSGEFLFQFDGHEAPLNEQGNESFGNACGIAVDSSGNIYVAGYFSGVNKFERTGGGVKWVSRISLEELGFHPCDLAMAPGDNLYVGGNNANVKRFKDDVFQNVADPGPGTSHPQTNSAITVNPATENLFVGRGDFVAEDEPSGALLDEFGQGLFEEVQGDFKAIKGVGAVSAGNKVFVSDFIANKVYIFGPETVTVPDVTLGAATNVGPFAMTLNGTVDPSGAPTSWFFRYREQGAEGWSDAEEHEAGSGAGALEVSETIEGLSSNTTYEFQLVATNTEINKAARSPIGNQITAISSPLLGNTFVAPRTTTTARLNGYVKPENDGTVYWFEYGPTDCEASACESAPATHDAGVGGGLVWKLVAQDISGLNPGTVYHYRFVAENSGGITRGSDMTFTTRTVAETTVGERGIELVSSPDNGNNSVSQLLFDGQNNLSADGNHAIWSVFAGAPVGTTGARGSFLAERTATGWTSHSLIPPASEQPGGGNLRFEPLLYEPQKEFKHFAFVGTEGSLSASTETPLIRTDDRQNLELLAPAPNIHTIEPLEFSEDGRHLFFMGQLDLPETSFALLDFGSGEATDIGRLPDGSSPQCGIVPFENFNNASQTYAGLADGSRAYFTTSGDDCSSPPQLYVRDLEDEQTTLVSGPVVAGTEGVVILLRASKDGRSVLFKTSSRLAATDSNERWDIYKYTEGSGNECLTCSLPSSVDPGFERDQNIKAPDDLSRVYFISPALFRPDEGGEKGKSNLYVWHSGHIDYIGILGAHPESDVALATAAHYALSADGRFLLFDTAFHGVTTDDIGNDCLVNNPPEPAPCKELYLYDDAYHSVECVSCTHDGVTDGSAGIEAVEGFGFGTAFLSGDGSTIAFRTSSALTPADVNRTADVYEWHNGAVRLVTNGVTKWPTSKGSPIPAGISADGSSILFTVAAKLTGAEVDGLANMYVARVGGGFPAPAPPPVCTEDSCQGPLTPAPLVTASGSELVEGGAARSGEHRRHKHKRHKRKRAPRHNRHAHNKQGGNK